MLKAARGALSPAPLPREGALAARVGAVLLVATALAWGCSARTDPSNPAGGSAPRLGGAETGFASWYGPTYHGRATASGERYNMFAMTAAHRTLPFGTRLRVTNLENGRDTLVTVNDRGPFVRGRIVDLSYAAAKQLAMTAQGLTRVRIEVVGVAGS